MRIVEIAGHPKQLCSRATVARVHKIADVGLAFGDHPSNGATIFSYRCSCSSHATWAIADCTFAFCTAWF